MEKEFKEEINPNFKDITFFNVYKTATGLYTLEDICKEYNVGNFKDTRDIKDYHCIYVSDEDLDIISKKSKENGKRLVPNIMIIFELQLVMPLRVFVDTNHCNKYYIKNSLCEKYNIKPISKRTIDKNTYSQITEKDIKNIELQSTGEKIRLKRKLIEIELDDEVTPATNLFMLYLDNETQKYFVEREILELCRSNNIEIEGTPKVINNKNCYSITENQLNEIEKQLNYHSVEQLLRPVTEETQQTNDNDTNSIISEMYQMPSREELFKEVREYDNSKVNDDIKPYLDRIAPANNEIEKPTIVYQDKNNDKLYLPTEPENATTTIMNKPCRETDLNEIKEINKKTVIAPLYTAGKKEYDVIVCNNKGQLFVSHSILSDLGFYLENPYRIIINKEIYEEISEEDIDLIKSLESDNCHINIIMKQIAPKRG